MNKILKNSFFFLLPFFIVSIFLSLILYVGLNDSNENEDKQTQIKAIEEEVIKLGAETGRLELEITDLVTDYNIAFSNYEANCLNYQTEGFDCKGFNNSLNEKETKIYEAEHDYIKAHKELKFKFEKSIDLIYEYNKNIYSSLEYDNLYLEVKKKNKELSIYEKEHYKTLGEDSIVLSDDFYYNYSIASRQLEISLAEFFGYRDN